MINLFSIVFMGILFLCLILYYIDLFYNLGEREYNEKIKEVIFNKKQLKYCFIPFYLWVLTIKYNFKKLEKEIKE